jgi:uncharacterized protein YndB with AHSA1/START domain
VSDLILDLDCIIKIKTMEKNLTSKVSTDITVPITKVWDALTKPELIKEYMFGTEAVSDWKVGSPIIFKGEWEGKSYEDKGTILAVAKPTFFQYNYWSNISGTSDSPDNYATITYVLSEQDNKTNLIITQDKIETQESKEKMEQNWAAMLQTIKKMLEKN